MYNIINNLTSALQAVLVGSKTSLPASELKPSIFGLTGLVLSALRSLRSTRSEEFDWSGVAQLLGSVWHFILNSISQKLCKWQACMAWTFCFAHGKPTQSNWALWPLLTVTLRPYGFGASDLIRVTVWLMTLLGLWWFPNNKLAGLGRCLLSVYLCYKLIYELQNDFDSNASFKYLKSIVKSFNELGNCLTK